MEDIVTAEELANYLKIREINYLNISFNKESFLGLKSENPGDLKWRKS